MEKLTNEQLLKVNGGMGIWAILGIVSGITFLVGAIDGYVRPLKCRK